MLYIPKNADRLLLVQVYQVKQDLLLEWEIVVYYEDSENYWLLLNTATDSFLFWCYDFGYPIEVIGASEILEFVRGIQDCAFAETLSPRLDNTNSFVIMDAQYYRSFFVWKQAFPIVWRSKANVGITRYTMTTECVLTDLINYTTFQSFAGVL